MDITPSSLPGGVYGENYFVVLTASEPVSWALLSGDLPPGLGMGGPGLTAPIFGTPFAPCGSYSFTLRITAADHVTTHTQSFTIEITGCPDDGDGDGTGSDEDELTLEPETLPDGEVGQDYSEIVVVDGGTPPYTLEIEGDQIDGVIFDPELGTLIGKPTIPSVFDFTIKATDSADTPAVAERTYTVTIVQSTGVGDAKQAPVVRVSPLRTTAVPPIPSTITLTGTVVSDPESELTTFSWTQTSGPTDAVILAPSALSTSIQFTVYAPGNYSFQLQAFGAEQPVGVSATVVVPNRTPPRIG